MVLSKEGVMSSGSDRGGPFDIGFNVVWEVVGVDESEICQSLLVEI